MTVAIQYIIPSEWSHFLTAARGVLPQRVLQTWRKVNGYGHGKSRLAVVSPGINYSNDYAATHRRGGPDHDQLLRIVGDHRLNDRPRLLNTNISHWSIPNGYGHQPDKVHEGL